MFAGSALTRIVLNRNKIHTVADGAFSTLQKQLKHLDLVDNCRLRHQKEDQRQKLQQSQRRTSTVGDKGSATSTHPTHSRDRRLIRVEKVTSL